MNVQDIKIKDIVVTQNSRVDMKDLPELMESIKQHGLLHPIHVEKGSGGKYIFESGRRRLLACQKLGHQTIPAVVGEEKKFKDLSIVNLIENVQRKDLTVVELGRVVVDLKDGGMNEKEIAVAINLPVSKIKIALESYSRIPARFRKKIAFMDGRAHGTKGKISASTASGILGIRRRHKLSQQDFDKLFEVAIDENLSQVAVATIAGLMGTGLNINQALKEREKYKNYTLVIAADEDQVMDLKNRYKVNEVKAPAMIIYGEIQETLKRPSFIK